MAHLNDILNEFARAFVGSVTSDREIAFPEQLPRHQLDGSIDSLHLVDRYLEFLHDRREHIPPGEWDSTVLWCGAYVGEVIRHAREGELAWTDYNEYMPKHSELQPLIPERTVATCALLIGPNGSMSMPLNKVARFIEEGPENSVHFFAQCDLSKRRTRRRERWWSALFRRRPNS